MFKKKFKVEFTPEQLVNLGIYIDKMMITGAEAEIVVGIKEAIREKAHEAYDYLKSIGKIAEDNEKKNNS